MASASMPSNSDIKPIFSDVEATTINDYFGNLIRKQSINGWYDRNKSNYLTIENLDFFNNFIGKKIKILQVDKLYNNNNSKSLNIKKLSKFWIFFDKNIQIYKVNILGEKNKNNIKELNNSSKTELISIITSLIHILIKEYILNSKYFNQTQLSRTLSDKSFIFIKDDELKSILDNLDSKRFLRSAHASIKKSGEQYVATKKAVEASQKAAQEAEQKAAEKVAQNKRINDQIANRLADLRRRGGVRKLTKNKTTKNKTTKNKTTKHKTTKNKTTKNKKIKNKTTKNKK